MPATEIKVDDKAALRLSPEGMPALALIVGPRLAVSGLIGPRCRDCRDFQTVVTKAGTVSCHCLTRGEVDRPPLPVRPEPHERDGRQSAPAEPARGPHARHLALLAG
ncbi:hypothetical protein ACFOSC_27940 [Streptantibioticus rubrisoli]|uniref:Uncharacterized protein n=1 Tax=Streptantibioticus rubrisoli TaxID=1387313 RepID=A0ABT1PKC9_9ACTN|nr:hypothetical protein [Streptantibioticus rubrisoli]MCQ4045816.1 hypothetical protein [Streptantibioticus rubrisoli]